MTFVRNELGDCIGALDAQGMGTVLLPKAGGGRMRNNKSIHINWVNCSLSLCLKFR